MTTFRDNEGRTWSLRISVRTVMVLREEIKFDLLDVQQYRSAVTDPVLCGRVVFRCLVENANRSVKEDDFLSSLFGDSIDEMRDAFGQAVLRFFPTSLRAAAEGMQAQTPQLDGTKSSGDAPVSSG